VIPAFPICHTCDVALPTSTQAEEVVVSPTVTSTDEIDLEIAVAYVALGAARSGFTRCPSGENERLVDEAEGALNRLLEARFAVQR
jgi:hypothetical protein